MMKNNEHLSHFKTSRIKLDEPFSYRFLYQDREYIIDFHDSRVEFGLGYCVKSIDEKPVESLLLQWLTVYFGESATASYATRNNTNYYERGYQTFDFRHFKKFIKKVSTFPFVSYTNWRNELIRKSLVVYCMGVELSINAMPITVGQFALSIEGISNAYLNHRSKYKTLGEKPYKKLLNTRLLRQKRSKKYGDYAKNFSKYIGQEIDVITEIRNKYCGHSLVHSKKERNQFIAVMNAWAVKHGWDSKNSRRKSYRTSIMEQTMQIHSNSLFKLSMNTNRLLFFYYLNLSPTIFTEYDFTLFGFTGYKELVIEHPSRIS